jgi:hypothetical protein
MDNPETPTALNIQDTGRRQTQVLVMGMYISAYELCSFNLYL